MKVLFWGKNENMNLGKENLGTSIAVPTKMQYLNRIRILMIQTNQFFSVALTKKYFLVWGSISKDKNQPPITIFPPIKLFFPESVFFSDISFYLLYSRNIVLMLKDGSVCILEAIDSGFDKTLFKGKKFVDINVFGSSVYLMRVKKLYRVFKEEQKWLISKKERTDFPPYLPFDVMRFNFPVSG